MTRAIELFGCAGGMAEGFRRAGIDFAWSFDADPDACASYAANLGTAPVRMDAHDLLRLVKGGWSPGPIDLIVADPPCTPWSRAGRRLGTSDPRDCLAVTIELIFRIRPAAYLIGNVPGLKDATHWPFLQQALAPLWADGYCIRDYACLDAADYGVPQHRVRPFWFGHLDGPCLRWPTRTHAAPDDPCVVAPLPECGALLPWRTCGGALGHLDAAELGRSVRLRWKATTDHRPSSPDEPARTLTRNANGDGALYGRARGQNGREYFSRTDRPARVVGTSTLSDGNILAWPWARPATTIDADERLSLPGHHGGANGVQQKSGPNAIVLSERAGALLQGFSDEWVFVGRTKRARWNQLGQAMPPALAEAVARSIAARGEREIHVSAPVPVTFDGCECAGRGTPRASDGR